MRNNRQRHLPPLVHFGFGGVLSRRVTIPFGMYYSSMNSLFFPGALVAGLGCSPAWRARCSLGTASRHVRCASHVLGDAARGFVLGSSRCIHEGIGVGG